MANFRPVALTDLFLPLESRNGRSLHPKAVSAKAMSASASDIATESLDACNIQVSLAEGKTSRSLRCTGRCLNLPGMLTLAAFRLNNEILAIDCSRLVPSINIKPSTPTPPASTPTLLQTTKPHLPYIDLIPFPLFRDDILRACEVVQSEDFWHDMVSGKLKVWGQTPWDRRGWEMHEDFVAKWWWVIAEDMLEETNFWRVSRGKDPLLPRLRSTTRCSHYNQKKKGSLDNWEALA